MEYHQAANDVQEFREALHMLEIDGKEGPAFATMPCDMVRQIGLAFGNRPSLDEETNVSLFGVPIMVLTGGKSCVFVSANTSPLGRLAAHMRAYYDTHRKLPRRIIVPRDVIAEIPEEWHLPLGAPLSVKVHDHNVILMGE